MVRIKKSSVNVKPALVSWSEGFSHTNQTTADNGAMSRTHDNSSAQNYGNLGNLPVYSSIWLQRNNIMVNSQKYLKMHMGKGEP